MSRLRSSSTPISCSSTASRPIRRYRFKHALIQEAAYESMLRSRRREIHAEIAEALVRLQPAIVETAPETVATHLARAGDEAGAAEYWQKAGQLAQRNSAYREAIGAYQNALRHMSKQDRAFVDVNRAIASAYFAAGEHELNLKHLEEAAGAAEASGDPVTMTEIVMQQCHVFSQFGDDAEQAIHVGRRALEMANRLEDEGLAYGARFALGHACWIGGDYDSAIELLSANLPENMGDPTRIRDFGTAGSLLLDSCRFLDRRSPIAAISTEPFRSWSARKPSRKRTLSTCPSSVIIMLEPTCSAATQLRRRRYRWQPSSTQLKLDSSFHCPGNGPCWGTHMRSTGNLTPPSRCWKPLSKDRKRFICDIRRRSRARYWLRRSRPGNPESSRRRRDRAGRCEGERHRALEAELLRVKAASLLSLDADAAEAAANEGYKLAQELGLGPEQAHGLRTLGDIMAAKGDTTKAEELHDLARAKYRSLGMKRWAEGPWR